MSWSKEICERVNVGSYGTLIRYCFHGSLEGLREIPQEEYCRNVELRDKNDQVVWKIAPANADPIEFYVGFNIKDDCIEVISFSGCAYALDLQTGNVRFLDWRK